MITLSYSTINMLYEASHNWINKQMGIKQEDKIWFTQGKEAHRIIQDHVSGRKKDPRLEHITFHFPIVEEEDFDERTKFIIKVNEEYQVRGYMDGFNLETKQMLEIKSSSTLWTAGKYATLMQRKVYALGRPDMVEGVLITCSRDPNKWAVEKPKTVIVQMTDADRAEAKEWIAKGIEIIEKGDFKGGLDEHGRCTNPRCLYGKNCLFKN